MYFSFRYIYIYTDDIYIYISFVANNISHVYEYMCLYIYIQILNTLHIYIYMGVCVQCANSVCNICSMIGVPSLGSRGFSGVGDKDAACVGEAFRLLGVERPRAVYFIIDHWVLFKVIFYFPNRQSTIWGIYSEFFLFFGNPLSKSKTK